MLMGNILCLEIHHLWGLLVLLLIVPVAISYPHFRDDFPTLDNPSNTYSYARFPEVEKHCGFLISSASELPPDDNRGGRMKKELFFRNGDWNQEPGGVPLLPIDSREMPSNTFGYGPPLNLVSFWLNDVDPVRRAKNTVSVSGVMEIGRIRSGSFSYKPYDWSPKFYLDRGINKLTIIFEGIYLESQENGGRRLMCFLGNATIPKDSTQKLDSCDHGDLQSPCQPKVNNLPSTLQDDQIILLLEYPKDFTLTSRGISGELKSLNQKGKPAYFDKVHISSQPGDGSKYRFGSEKLVARACSPYPYPDSLINQDVQDVEMFKGHDFCEDLRQFVWNEVFEFASTWKNVVRITDGSSKIGPFLLGNEIEASYNSSDKLRLMIQELVCEPGFDQEGFRTAMVSAVFRVIQKSEYLYGEEEKRTGLSSMTLSSEGRWHSSHGQLCMVGCIGPASYLSDRCKSRITLYFPLTFSIKQHSRVVGTISSINPADGHTSLMFQKLTTPNEFTSTHPRENHFKWSYTYTKLKQAREFQSRSQPSNWERILRKSILRYPTSKGEDIASFSFLTDVLSIEVRAAPQTLTNSQAPKTNVKMVLLSIGSLFGRYGPHSYQENPEAEKAFHSISEEIEVSGHLKVEGGKFSNVSLFFEGIYDPTLGQMYLIGCRDVLQFQGFNNDDRDLEGGMDCSIEIKVEYSAKNARWLLNPNIKFSINSQRTKEDPLYFSPISSNTFLLSYSKKFDFLMVRKGFEEGLRVLLLVMAILCIHGQLRYTESQGHTTAYISLVMLGLHALGFSIPLITGDEVLLRWKEFAPYKSSAYDQFQNFHIFQSLDLFIKFLMLIALLETAKLLQRVWESRKLRKGQAINLNLRIPSDKLVFLLFLLIHMLGFFTLHTIRRIYGIPLLLLSENSVASANIRRLQRWWTELENYGGLVQDFFLLPQIIGNAVWGVQGKPLRKLYYLGFTTIRLVLQAYDYASDPVPNPTNSELEFEYLGVESYYKHGNVIIGVIVVILAMLLYFQQNGWCKIRPIHKLEDGENVESKPDNIYERLLSE